MIIYNLKEAKIYHEFHNAWRGESKNIAFLILTENEFSTLDQQLGMEDRTKKSTSTLSEKVFFETYHSFEYLKFMYFETKDQQYCFNPFELYLTEQFLVLTPSSQDTLQSRFIEIILEKIELVQGENISLSWLYYEILCLACGGMFDAMSIFEVTLSNMENDIITRRQIYNLGKLVDIKGQCFEAKRFLNLFCLVGEQILLNENNIIEPNKMKLFQNLNGRINRLYQYGASINDFAEHLMSLYDTAVSSRTNDVINKLTIITVFALPLTFLTGLYGMNFKNMPELEHPYGYFILLSVMILLVLVTYWVLKRLKLL